MTRAGTRTRTLTTTTTMWTCKTSHTLWWTNDLCPLHMDLIHDFEFESITSQFIFQPFFLCSAQRCSSPGETRWHTLERINIHVKKMTKTKLSLQRHHTERWNSTSTPTKGEYSSDTHFLAIMKNNQVQLQDLILFQFAHPPRVQPKARTSSEESMASEDDRSRKHSSLNVPTPLIRTSSGTHVRPKPHPRGSRHSGELP